MIVRHCRIFAKLFFKKLFGTLFLRKSVFFHVFGTLFSKKRIFRKKLFGTLFSKKRKA